MRNDFKINRRDSLTLRQRKRKWVSEWAKIILLLERIWRWRFARKQTFGHTHTHTACCCCRFFDELFACLFFCLFSNTISLFNYNHECYGPTYQKTNKKCLILSCEKCKKKKSPISPKSVDTHGKEEPERGRPWADNEWNEEDLYRSFPLYPIIFWGGGWLIRSLARMIVDLFMLKLP